MSSDLNGVPFEGETADIINKYCLSKIRKGYRRYRGCSLPIRYSEMAEKIENFEVRDDDVWVMSYPKSGTTWTQEMVWCLANNLDFEGAKELLAKRFPFFDHSFVYDYSSVMTEDIDLPPYALDSITYIDRIVTRRFIKTHLPWQLLPKQIRDGTKKPKMIYVCRNVKDTCISYYHHHILLEGYTGDFQDFCKLFLDDAVGFSPFWGHIRGFWERRDQHNVLFLRYEDMKKDLATVIRRTATFLDTLISDDKMKVLCEHLSFNNMKNNPAVNFEPILEVNRILNITPEDGQFMRKGTGGEWRNQMTDKLVSKFDQWTCLHENGSTSQQEMHIWD